MRQNSSSHAAIGNITGDFIDNKSVRGGAIYNFGYTSDSVATIGNITGDFTGNNASRSGGAIYSAFGTIGNITGDFTGNSATTYGGAISNYGTIGNITGDFTGNNASRSGGAIYSSGKIGEKDNTGKVIGGIINSNFYDNYVSSNSSKDGAIWTGNDLNIIADKVTSTFQGNYVLTDKGEKDYQAIWVNNANFKPVNLSLIARNNGIINMYDAINGTREVTDKGTKEYNVNITGDETGRLNLFNDIKNVANVNIDKITVNLADEESEMHNYEFNSLNSDKSAKYIIDIDFVNKTSDKITTEAASEGTVLIDYFNIINGTDVKIDKDYKIEILYGETEGLQLALSDRAKAQLPQDEIYLTSTFEDITDKIKVITKWDDIYNVYNQETEIWGKLGVATTHTTNDSIGVVPNNYKKLDPIFKYQLDTLAMWSALDTDEKKEFNFTSEDNKYLVASAYPPLAGLGETKGSELSINGVINENNRSTIDMHSRKGFEVKQAQTLNMNNVNMVNAVDGALEVTDANAQINLKNTSFYNNTSSTQGAAIYSEANVNMTSDNAVTELTGNLSDNINESVYIANKDKALTINTVNNGTFTLNDKINGEKGYTVNITGDGTGAFNLFGDIENANVNVDNVTVNFTDGVNRDYTFESLNSSENAKYLIGIDFKAETCDNFTTSNESNGVVTIAGLQIANKESANFDEDYTIRILNTPTDTLQLALSDELANELNQEEYKIGISVKEVLDEINAVTNWKDEYKAYEQQADVYGKLGLKTSEGGTTNDSIGINISRTEGVGELVYKGLQGGALRLWNMLDTNEDKVFNFDTAQDRLLVAKDFPEVQGLEETKGNNITINGVIDGNNRSVIDLNYLKGFDVKHNAVFNVNNVSLENAHDRALEVNDSNAKINLYNTSFINNIALKDGGAIYSTADVNMTSDNTVTQIRGNTINATDTDVPVNESIYMANKDKTLTINTVNNGELLMNDAINGEKGYHVNITGDGTGTYGMYNDINNANVTIGNTNINTVDNAVHTYVFDSLTVNGTTNMSLDVDLENGKMDRISANDYGAHSGNINVIDMNLLSDAKEKVTDILFADKGLKDNVTTEIKEVSPNYRKTAYSPIYKYSLNYDNREDGGYFVFERGDKIGGSSSEVFNPAILATPVAAQLGGYLTQLNSYDEAFRNMDMYMLMTKKQRQAMKFRNKYASAKGIMTFDPNQNIHDNAAGWFRPYTTFERVPLKNGPKVSNVAYGSFFGGDSELYDLGRGWDGIWGVYAGYNGSHQAYNGIGIWQNGGTLGAVGMAYKNNFFTGLTLNAGANAGQASTMYGNDDFSMLMAGVASKTGYNWELADGKFIIQPNFLMSYSFVNTFDYTNAAGVKIDSDSLNAIQLEPGIKFIGNLKNAWQPYAGVSMVWNIIDRTKFQANDVSLPEMSIKPFVKYGLGVRKTWGERLTGFFQTYLTNGGRNGVGLQAGFSFALGKNTSDSIKSSNNMP